MPKSVNKTVLILLLLVLNLFWLPTISPWTLLPQAAALPSEGRQILDYQHPLQPILKLVSPPILATTSYILIDLDTNQTILSQNPHQKIYPASTTKLATALTALNVYPLEEVVTITEAYTEGKVMGLVPQEKITVKSLVDSLLVYSANDAAFNLASHHTGGTIGFIKEMNQLAQKIGMTQTHFTNFDGIHSPEHYSTAYDLAQLARAVTKYSIIRDVVKQQHLLVTDVGQTITHDLVSTNELLGKVPEIEGLKTGWTPEAGGCFVGLINLGGHHLVSVVAQSPDRFADTQKLIDWAKANLTYQPYQP
jgi:D-alanyl-D-alanine carboxypeptidase